MNYCFDVNKKLERQNDCGAISKIKFWNKMNFRILKVQMQDADDVEEEGGGPTRPNY